jgi:hypothetical protein
LLITMETSNLVISLCNSNDNSAPLSDWDGALTFVGIAVSFHACIQAAMPRRTNNAHPCPRLTQRWASSVCWRKAS